MKALTIAIAALVWVAAVALGVGKGTVYADAGPHQHNTGVTADNCAACHRAHTGNAPELLVQAQPALCYTCHGTGGSGSSLDVQDGKSTSPAGALRGGGFGTAMIDSAHPTGQLADPPNTGGTIPVLTTAATVSSSHSVDSTTVTAWGNGATGAGAPIQLRCGSCHDPHGNGNYRILRPDPKQSGVALPGIAIADTGTHTYVTTNYWNVSYTENANVDPNISAWCSTCHTRYLADNGGPTTPLSGDTIFTYRHETNDTAAGLPICIQCHVAHGSNASVAGTTYSSNVNWPNGSPGGTDSRLLRIDNRGVCQMCHNR